MPIVTNPTSPEKGAAEKIAQRIAAALRKEMPEYRIRIDETIGARFHVIVEVPFRREFMTFADRQREEKT